MILRPLRLLFSFVCLIALSGCVGLFPSDKIDPSGGLTRAEYLALRDRDIYGENEGEEAFDTSFAPPPEAAPAARVESQITQKAAPKMSQNDKNVSLSVTDAVPLREVLLELGREGGVNMEIDPRISGGVVFTARAQPFGIVLRRLCALAGLRFAREDGFVRVELDEPYQKTYSLNNLSLVRNASSDVGVATNVFDAELADSSNARSNGSGDAGSNNSTARISSNAQTDFWSDVERSLPHVLASISARRALTSAEKEASKPAFSVDRQAGVVSVFGTSAQHEAVAAYLEKLEKKTSAQVLIEARIIEVELNDAFQSGVNWSALFKNVPSITAAFGAPGASALLSGAESGVFTAAVDTKDITGILNLVRTFGTTRVLSAPRLTVMNNQTAMLKVARNEVYFLTSAKYPTTLSSNGTAVTGTPVFSSTPHTVPVGLVMTVQPSIDAAAGRVSMTLRPTISRVVSYVNDPSIALNAASAGADANIVSRVPVLAVREMDSVLQLKSGEVAVLGGLMQDGSENEEQGVPPFDRLPVVGNLAKSRDHQGTTSELVILLRATILDMPEPDAADRDLYERYARDPRPFASLPPEKEITQ